MGPELNHHCGCRYRSKNTELQHSPNLVGMRHGLQLSGITVLWLVGLNIDRDCLVPHCIMRSCDQWEFPPFFRPQWESLCTTLKASKCLPLRLCKGTVKESTKTRYLAFSGPISWSVSTSGHAISKVLFMHINYLPIWSNAIFQNGRLDSGRFWNTSLVNIERVINHTLAGLVG